MSVLASRARIGAAVVAILTSGFAHGASFYYGGYNVDTSTQGTPDLPTSGPFVVPGSVTFYDDAAGTVQRAAGTGFVTSTDTSAELVLGGSANALPYTAIANSNLSGSTAIRGIALTSLNAGTNTLRFNSTSNYYSIASGGTGTNLPSNGIRFDGTSNWNFETGSAAAPLRMQNSSTIYGTGTGVLSIAHNLANGSGSPGLNINLTNGGTVKFGVNNDFGSRDSAAASQFTLTAGTVEFSTVRPFGNTRNQLRLNGGTLVNNSGTTVTTYSGNLQTIAGGIVFGGNSVTLAGSANWSLGASTVTLTGNRMLVANTAGTTGTTIGGAIGENGGAYGLTVGAASTGKLTLTGANTYTGTTTVAGGTLVLGQAAQANVLSPTGGGADVGGGKLIFDYTGGTSPALAIKALLDPQYAGNFTAGQIRSTTLAAGRTLGYGDDGVSAVTVRVTLPGDANLDGVVNFNDFLVLQANFGQAATRFDQGNFNYDEATNFNDFLLLQANFGQSVNGAAVAVSAGEYAALTAFAAAVPEPASLAVLGLGAAALVRRRRA